MGALAVSVGGSVKDENREVSEAARNDTTYVCTCAVGVLMTILSVW